MGVNLRGIANPRKADLEDFKNKKFAIDAFNALYQFLSIIRGMSGDLLHDSKGRVTSHLSGLFYRNVNLIETGISTVYVFDGPPPRLKARTVEIRKEIKAEASKLYAEAIEKSDFQLAKKYASATAYLTDEMIGESKLLLEMMGIPWVQAPSEGEASAAELNVEGAVDFAASQDYDSLLFGAKRLVRNVTISGKRKLPNKNIRIDVIPETIELEEVLSTNGITREQLVDIGILLGTDFNPDGFDGIGPATALKLIKKNGRIEDIEQIKNQLNFDPKEIREIFLHPEVVDPKSVKIEFRKPDKEKLLAFLCSEHDFSRERVLSSLDRLAAIEKKESQSLEQWFQ